jgi:hypothetical protein
MYKNGAENVLQSFISISRSTSDTSMGMNYFDMRDPRNDVKCTLTLIRRRETLKEKGIPGTVTFLDLSKSRSRPGWINSTLMTEDSTRKHHDL